MKINSENLIKDAQQLRKTQQELRSKKSDSKGKESRPSQQIQVTLGEIRVNLRSHQQTIAKLQLESVGLEQIERNLDFLLKQNPADYEAIKQAKSEIDTALDATRFQQQPLIPAGIREQLGGTLEDRGLVNRIKQEIALRRDEISGQLKMEFNQINKIQVSFENILSLNMPSNEKVRTNIEEIKQQLSLQEQIQANLNPATVMGLLQEA